MFFRKVDSEVKLALTLPQFAKEIFAVIDSNREFFKEWLPWVNQTKEFKDTQSYIKSRLEKLANGTTLHTTVFYKDAVVGSLDLNVINLPNKRATVGYWLDKNHNGKGIMSRAVAELIKIAFKEYELEKIIIECEVANCRSCNLAKRLGFKHEGILRKHYNINGVQKDMNVYGLLKQKWLQSQQAH